MEATNLSKIKRNEMIGFLEHLKENNNDDKSIKAINEIMNQINSTKYGLVWEQHQERVDIELEKNIPIFSEINEKKICSDESSKYNFLLEGDNLHSLYLLEKTHRNKIDIIYIDPPYNRGKDDFVYNDDYISEEDSYVHSKWLSFMHRRLKIAKDLLAAHGTIFISIDDNEFSQLKLMCDDIFGTSNYLGTIHWRRRNSQPNDKTKLIGIVAEYILVYTKDLNSLNELGIGKVDVTGNFSNPDNDPNGPWATKPWKIAEGRSGTKYTIISPTGKVFNETWSGTKETFEEALKDGRIIFTNNGNGLPRKKYYLREREEEGQCANNWWDWETYGSNQDATSELKKIFDGVCPFDNPKPTKLIKRIIKLGCVKKDAIVLDFFAGSGTTGDAVLQLNAEDGGNRKFILCTNNEINGFRVLDYLHDNKLMLDYNPGNKTKQNTIFSKINKYFEDKEELKEEMFIKRKQELDEYGICKSMTYPRLKSKIVGKDITENDLECGYSENLKYYITDWTPRKPEDYLLSNVLLLHIKEMIELQNAIEVDDDSNVIIFNKDDYKKYILNEEKYEKIKNMWVNQNIIFTGEELQKLKQKGFKYIPKEFFGQELKEAAE